MSVVVGIDPGVTGGIAVLSSDGRLLATHRMPVVGAGRKSYDVGALLALLQGVAIEYGVPRLVVVEAAQMVPGNGALSCVGLARCQALVEGLCAAMGYSCAVVGPRKWQGLLLAGCGGDADDTKARAAVACSRLWPAAEWGKSKAAATGLRDAALLAEYGRRYVVGGGL